MKNKFLYISICLFLLSLIFLLIQGVKNYKFYRSEDRKSIVERTLYEQFSYEVYSSINKKLAKSISIKTQCSPEEEKFEFNLNLDTFFDCRGIYTDDINSNCRNSIVNNYTNCQPDSYIPINDNENWNILDNDHRELYCQYYSKFTRRISILYNKTICKSKDDQLSYEYLLRNSIQSSDYKGDYNFCLNGFQKCGILDTKGNILCLPENIDCPKNKIELSSELEDNIFKIKIDDNTFISLNNDSNLNIINSIIISENQPLNHEWEKMIKETLEEIKSEEKKKRRILTGEDFKLIDSETDNSYKRLEGFSPLYLNVLDIKANNTIDGFSKNIYNLKQNLNIYTRNYIGFKNSEELDKFKKKFNDKDDTDNPLYKLSSLKHQPLVTIIFSTVFLCISFAYLVFKNIFKKEDNISKILFYIYTIIIILFFIAELIIISVHFRRYPKIHIDMDNRMKRVLELYNRRTFNCQKFRIICLCFNVISIIFTLIIYFKQNKNEVQPIPENE